jgi:predicted GNAT family acetyltransferase
MSDTTISHQPKHHEFVLEKAGKRLGYLDYTLTPDKVMTIEYVQVDPPLRGTGMGNRLVEAAVAWARESDLSLQARCSFARAVLNAAHRR